MVFDALIRSDSEVVLEGRDSERPSKLTYTLILPDTLSIVLERTRDHKSLRDEYRIKRRH